LFLMAALALERCKFCFAELKAAATVSASMPG
jgi:hypothetical protein